MGTQTASGSAGAMRPATTTFLGDTGLWFVPTAEVLAHGEWSASGYRRGTDYVQGFTNVGDFAGTCAVGLGNGGNLSRSSSTPASNATCARNFLNDTQVGGIVDCYPRANSGWRKRRGLLHRRESEPGYPGQQQASGHGGARHRQGTDRERRQGTSTGKADFAVDFIASSEFRTRFDLSGATSGAVSPMGWTARRRISLGCRRRFPAESLSRSSS